VAVDPPSAYSAGNVRNEPAAPWHEIVAKAEIKPEIVVLDSAKDRLSHRAHVKLMVTAQPRVVVYHSPTNPAGEEFSSDFVAGRGIDRAQQIPGLNCEFEALRIKVAAHGFNLGFRRAAEEPEANAEKQQDSACTSVFHSRATIGTLDRIAIFL
jgi:hypothetical protein